MFKLKKLNVVKIVATEHQRDRLLAQGFVEIEDMKEEVQYEIKVEAKEAKKEEKPKKEKKATE